MSISPWLRTPFTDLTAGVGTYQWFSPCADFEMRMMDCMEAYGLDRGVRKCDLLIKDFQECVSQKKRIQRMEDMRAERNRQYKAGERSKEERYMPGPPPDIY